MKRDERFTVRLTADEKAFIKEKMKKSGFRNVADYFLHCVYSNHTLVVDTTPILEVKTELNRIGNNVNQIAKMANTTGFLSKRTIEELIENMRKMQDTVNAAFTACAKGGEAVGLCEDSAC